MPAITIAFLRVIRPLAAIAAIALLAFSSRAQESQQDIPDSQQQNRHTQLGNSAPLHPADGTRHGLPLETFAVVPGTRFLVRLEQDISTSQVRRNQAFRVRTVEPLEAGSGIYLPSRGNSRTRP